jgi:hypothetical protein
VNPHDTPAVRETESRWVVIGVAVAVSLLFVQVAAGVLRGVVSDEPSFLERVQTCLIERETPFEPVDDDPIAASAGRGALRTTVDGNAVTVALGRSEDDAERVYDAYAGVATAEGVAALLDRRRKVVFLWDSAPTTEQRAFMYLCTLDAQE